ncbi:MAG: hypothetical protein V1887_04260 [Candidatus Aenigmatarchaeota archaeon]
MKFDYFATNRVEVPPAKRKDYMRLCFFHVTSQYDLRHHLNSLPKHIQARMLVDRNMDFRVGMRKEDAWATDPRGFSTMMYGEVGFASNIMFDGRNFRYRLYCSDDLKKRNLNILFEPMRLHEKTGPDAHGLNVTREDEKLEPIEAPFTWDDIRNHYKHGLEFEMKEARQRFGWHGPNLDGLDIDENYEKFEEARCLEDEKERAKKELHINRIVRRNLEKSNQWRESLKEKCNLFKEVRADIAKKLGRPAMLNVAYGTMPFLQNDCLDDSIAACWPVMYALPYTDGMNDRTLALLDAEIYVRPEGGCTHIVSFYPYTSPTEEIAELNAQLLKEDGPMRAMFAHEMLESFMCEKFRSIGYDFLGYMVDRGYRECIQAEKVSQGNERHRRLNSMLDRLGYSDCTEALLKRYEEAADAVIKRIDAEKPMKRGILESVMERYGMFRYKPDMIISAAEHLMGWKYAHMLAMKTGCEEWRQSIQSGKLPKSGMGNIKLRQMDAFMLRDDASEKCEIQATDDSEE